MTEYVEYPVNRPVRLRNKSCPYCGCKFDSSTQVNEEHTIGRRFVPKGAMENQFNLIFWACKECNEEKSQLEDDISVISMIPRSPGRGPEVEAILAAEVERKAHKSGSRRTGRSVARSEERVTLEGGLGTASVTFGFVAPPQIDHKRVYRLAQLHFDAFFYEAHYNNQSNLGGFFPHRFHYNAGYFPISNWGDERARWFMNITLEWPTISAVVTAKGFFKLILRHSPCMTMWACAAEWNQSMRVMRLLGKDADTLQALANSCPRLKGDWHKGTDGNPTKVVREQSLNPEEDCLFSVIQPDKEN